MNDEKSEHFVGVGMLLNKNESEESEKSSNKQNIFQVFSDVLSRNITAFADDSASVSKRSCNMSPFCKLLNKISFNPENPATQVAIGGTTGWIVGYVSNKVGRTAAIAVGGGFLLIQIAHQCGYLTIDWKKVNRDMDKAQRMFTDDHRDHADTMAQRESSRGAIHQASSHLNLLLEMPRYC